MKKMVFSSLLLAFAFSSAQAQINPAVKDAEEITYDWLVRIGDLTGYTDHISNFKKLFKEVKVKNFLEFGVGYSTKYFLDNCNKVISVEFVTAGYPPEWMNYFLGLYKIYSNWIPIVYFSSYTGGIGWAPYKYVGSDSVHNAASYQCSTHQSYALVDNFFIKELDSFVSRLIKSHSIDVGFVDAGIFIGGDLVQSLFDKVPIILAQNTYARGMGIADDVYGYTRVNTPDNYDEIFIPGGHGTTLWIVKKDQYQSLSLAMKKYAEGI